MEAMPRPLSPRLLVLPPSHYCERARWGLDHLGIPYHEERWAVGIHLPLARRIAKRTSLPILVTGTEVIQGSGDILTWAGLAGGDPALEQRFEKRIGVLLRQYIYSIVLADRSRDIRPLLFDGVPAWQAVLGRAAWPVTRKAMVAAMNARPSLTSELERRLETELDWFDSAIGDRRHLVGDRFGRADITAASLLSPLVRPSAGPPYGQVRLPDRIEDAIARWSARPLFRWVERTYAEHRRLVRLAP